MPNLSVPAKSINLTDFDFSVDRPRTTRPQSHDASVTIRMPGKNRKAANHELVFIPYFKKHRVKFKTVAIGKNKDKMQPPIVVFDQHTLDHENAPIRKYEKIGGIVNSKGHALKILSIFKIGVPANADEVLKVYFKLHPTVVNRNKLNYRICTVTLMKVIKPQRSRPITSNKAKKKKTLPTISLKPTAEKEKSTLQNII